MTARSRLSVALSTHQGGDHLRAQLASLASQSRLPDELRVRDDGSTDGTVAELEAFVRSAPFPVRLTVGPRIGLAHSLAAVVQDAEGDLIALCDQDDTWHPDKLARAVAALDARPSAMGFLTNGQLDGPSGGTTFDAVGFTPTAQHHFDADPVLVLAHRSVVTGHALVMRRAVVRIALPLPDAVGGPDAPYPDRWFALVAAGLGAIVVDDRPLVTHRQHAAQQTGVDARRWVLAAREAKRGAAQVASGGAGTRARLQARADLLDLAADRTENGSLRRAAAHLRQRAALPELRRRRADVIRGELHEYRWSGGRLVALADLLRPLH